MISLKRSNKISYKTVKPMCIWALFKSSWLDVKVDINSGGYFCNNAKKNVPKQNTFISRLLEHQQFA